MGKAKTLDVSTALRRIDRWLRDGRTLKVAIAGSAGLLDSGWGAGMTDGVSQLRLVYQRDADEKEVDETFDVSGSLASESSIWDATAAQQEKFGHFDESIGFALPDVHDAGKADG